MLKVKNGIEKSHLFLVAANEFEGFWRLQSNHGDLDNLGTIDLH